MHPRLQPTGIGIRPDHIDSPTDTICTSASRKSACESGRLNGTRRGPGKGNEGLNIGRSFHKNLIKQRNSRDWASRPLATTTIQPHKTH